MARGALALSRTRKGTGLHDDIKGLDGDNDFSGGCFFRAGCRGNPICELSDDVEFLIRFELAVEPVDANDTTEINQNRRSPGSGLPKLRMQS